MGNIFSFSKPALNRATTFNKVSPPASVTREKLLENTSFISLHWLKSSDTSSTLCDQNVRIATSDIRLTETNMSPAFLQHIVRKKTKELWKKEWAENEKGAITRKFFPSPEDASLLKRTYISHQTTQLLTGHCQLNYYFFKIKKIMSPLCECGQENETIEHYMFSCTRFSTQKKTAEGCLLEKFRRLPTTAFNNCKNTCNLEGTTALRQGNTETRWCPEDSALTCQNLRSALFTYGFGTLYGRFGTNPIGGV